MHSLSVPERDIGLVALESFTSGLDVFEVSFEARTSLFKLFQVCHICLLVCLNHCILESVLSSCLSILLSHRLFQDSLALLLHNLFRTPGRVTHQSSILLEAHLKTDKVNPLSRSCPLNLIICKREQVGPNLATMMLLMVLFRL